MIGGVKVGGSAAARRAQPLREGTDGSVVAASNSLVRPISPSSPLTMLTAL
jgi:hypothetical protein